MEGGGRGRGRDEEGGEGREVGGMEGWEGRREGEGGGRGGEEG